MWSIAFNFAWELLTGEVYRLWASHKAKEKTQEIANAPINNQEEAVDLLH